MNLVTYDAVQRALRDGTEPAMICAICPWDRNCINPPPMSRAEVEDSLEKARQQDARRVPKRGDGPLAGSASTLLTLITVGAYDGMAQVCPVLALRLRTTGGRKIAEAVKDLMQSWDDQA